MSQGNLALDFETKKVTRLLDVKLTMAENAELGIEAGRLSGIINKAKEEMTNAKNQFTAVVEKLEGGTASKDVECVMKLYYATRTVQVFDGETMLEERAMEDSEFQTNMPLQNGVVLPPEEDLSSEPQTEEQRKADIAEVISEEKNRKNKPSLVDM
jgi:hypothetical protein